MSALSVSVIIASRHRPKELSLCLTSLKFQTLPEFEVIVVGDPTSRAVIGQLALEDKIKHVPFDEANISRARNQGLTVSGGEIVVFLDDDAVPEPTWLKHLTAPFEDVSVDAAGGFVLGRNGISYQWKAEEITADGVLLPMDVNEPTVFTGSQEQAPKTHGTNCAFRRETLVNLGGFDEAYEFFLDETDVNLRLSRAESKTAIVPDALVHHHYAASARRRPDRTPRDLSQIGASQAYFLKKYDRSMDALKAARAEQRRRLVEHMISGRIEPDSVGVLLQSFDEGCAAGLTRKEGQLLANVDRTELLPFKTKAPSSSVVLFGWAWGATRLFEDAKMLAEADIITTVFLFSPTTLFHRRWFHPSGFWVQSGGMFGKSLRSDPYIRFWSMKQRAERERQLLAARRLCIVPIGADT